MLADKDRIFTNLYGIHDWGLEGARARGDWDARRKSSPGDGTLSSTRSRRRACAGVAGLVSRQG